MLTRIISGLVLLPLLFFVIINGGISIYLGALICSLIGLYEFFRVFEGSGYKPLKTTIYAMTVIMYTAMTYSGMSYSHIVISVTYLIFAVGAVYIMNRRIRVEDLMITIMGYIYTCIPLAHKSPQHGSDHIYMAGIHIRMGERYLCVLYRNVLWKA